MSKPASGLESETLARVKPSPTLAVTARARELKREGLNEKDAVAAIKTAHERLRTSGAGESAIPDLRVLGPSEPPVARLKDHFRRHALLFSPSARHLHTTIREGLRSIRPSSQVDQAIDIDPVSTL